MCQSVSPGVGNFIGIIVPSRVPGCKYPSPRPSAGTHSRPGGSCVALSFWRGIGSVALEPRIPRFQADRAIASPFAAARVASRSRSTAAPHERFGVPTPTRASMPTTRDASTTGRYLPCGDRTVSRVVSPSGGGDPSDAWK